MTLMTYYQTAVETLGDAELLELQEEIQDAGVLSEEGSGYSDSSWEAQAHERYYEIRDELDRRWELANPEEAARRRASYERMQAELEAVKNRLPKMFDNSAKITEMLRRA